jgi:hypothetical protein
MSADIERIRVLAVALAALPEPLSAEVSHLSLARTPMVLVAHVLVAAQDVLFIGLVATELSFGSFFDLHMMTAMIMMSV